MCSIIGFPYTSESEVGFGNVLSYQPQCPLRGLATHLWGYERFDDALWWLPQQFACLGIGIDLHSRGYSCGRLPVKVGWIYMS
jgi:hypothetical protein